MKFQALLALATLQACTGLVWQTQLDLPECTGEQVTQYECDKVPMDKCATSFAKIDHVDRYYQCGKSSEFNCLQTGPECKKPKFVKEEGWFKGSNGQTCSQVCSNNGWEGGCDKEKMAALTTNDKVAAGFKNAGYTCSSFHGPRNYAGTPFSKGSDKHDDCAPVKPGTSPSTINCDANSYGHHAPLCACIKKKSPWVKGKNGEVCNKVCKGAGLGGCDKAKMAALTTNDKVAAAFKKAGYTCSSFHAPRNYAGTPFSKGRNRNDDCAPVKPGTSANTINCDANGYGHHAPLCYCKEKSPWVKGKNGQVCNKVCKGAGFSGCDKAKMAALTTKDKVRDAFKKAGYTCSSYHGARNYAGTPFSKGRNRHDDCAPVKPGTSANTINCDANGYGHHAPLCYCK